PAGGSWYVERLTAELAGRAWELVREVERRGGMARALEAGFPQDRVARTAAERGGAVATRRTVIVGTNQYADVGEEIAIDAGGAARPSTAGDGDRAAVRVRPVAPHRAAEGFEALRLAVGAHRRAHGGGRVFVATLGQVARYMPRLDFTTGFFVSGGFEVERGPGFDTPQAAAAAALADAGEIIVLCGLDATYDDQAQPVARAVRDGDPRRILLLAGQPADDTRRAALEAAGIEGFIHARSNVLEVLSGLAAQLGVRAAAAPAVAATDDPEGGAS
ncbi:MAG: methylmalonyl-CoA mutase family protein, partial [Candidatus Eiseniibacteriota bacterium]